MIEACSRLLGRDLMYEGVSCIEFQNVGIALEALIKFADSMGIDWFLIADDDDAGTKYVAEAKKQLGQRPLANHVSQLAHGDLEVFLCMEGYGHVYEKYVSRDKQHIVTATKGTGDYWQQVTDAQIRNSKVPAAVEVIQEMEKSGASGIPQQLQDIVRCAMDLAKGA